MNGFGDSARPLQETTKLVDELVVEYITDLVREALDHEMATAALLPKEFGKPTLSLEDLIYVLRSGELLY